MTQQSNSNNMFSPRLSLPKMVLPPLALHLLLLLLLTPLTTAATTTTTAYDATLEACEQIKEILPDAVFYSPHLSYLLEVQSYWSSALHDIKPLCLVEPSSAAEVASVVRVLADHADVHFAVKSGGHDPNPGHASVDGGVLIDTRRMRGAVYDEGTGLAHVKPGGEWNDVITALEPHGVTIVGGRLGIVGVGGYLLQGGISFLSAQYGLAADNIVCWETVMPNGSIVNVDVATNPDLAVAMRGSGSQFGIVTQFTIKTHPIGKVWGGIRSYVPQSLYMALHKFVPNGASEDPRAAIIPSDFYGPGGVKLQFAYYFYDGATPPKTGSLADFLAIPHLTDSCGTQTYSSLLKANGAAGDLISGRTLFRTFTIPYVPSNPGIYAEISSKWQNITSPFLNAHLTSQCTVTFQPLPSQIGRRSQDRGGGAMGLAGDDPHRLLLELQCMWASAADDAAVHTLSRDMTTWLEGRMAGWLDEAGGGDRYMPFFMNDAMADQNVTGSYREYARFRELQREVDPEGLFRERGGGFTY